MGSRWQAGTRGQHGGHGESLTAEYAVVHDTIPNDAIAEEAVTHRCPLCVVLSIGKLPVGVRHLPSKPLLATIEKGLVLRRLGRLEDEDRRALRGVLDDILG